MLANGIFLKNNLNTVKIIKTAMQTTFSFPPQNVKCFGLWHLHKNKYWNQNLEKYECYIYCCFLSFLRVWAKLEYFWEIKYCSHIIFFIALSLALSLSYSLCNYMLREYLLLIQDFKGLIRTTLNWFEASTFTVVVTHLQ